MLHARHYAEFTTVTCLDWKPVLADDRVKEIITQSLAYLAKVNRIRVFGFVIMSNHMHFIWQMLGDHKREDVQRDFLKYTSQQIIRYHSTENPALLNHHRKIISRLVPAM